MKYWTESMRRGKSFIQYNEGRLDWSDLPLEILSKTCYWRKEKKGTRRRRRKEDVISLLLILRRRQFERGSNSSYRAENSLWKKVRTCRKTNYVNNDKMNCSPMANPHNKLYENRAQQWLSTCVNMPRAFNRIMAIKIDTRRSSFTTPCVKNLKSFPLRVSVPMLCTLTFNAHSHAYLWQLYDKSTVLTVNY